MQIRKEVHRAGGNNTENHCSCNQDFQADRKRFAEGDEEVTDSNIKSFERVARKYNVDFAVKKDKTMEPPKYLVFFKGKDADVIAQAFKEFVKVNEKKQQRPSLRQKLKGLQKIIAQNKNKERSREKNKDRGQSL